ncbi:unnamed protein product, partial [Sphacelaria rigidula]
MCKECGVKYEPITSATTLKENIFRNATGAAGCGNFGTASEYGWDSETKMEEKQSSPEVKYNEDDTYYRSVMSFGQPYAPTAAPTALPPHSPAASGQRWTPNGVAAASPARKTPRTSTSSRSTSELEYSDSDSKEDEEEKKEETYPTRSTTHQGGIMEANSRPSTRSSSPPQPPPYDSSRNLSSTPSPQKKRGAPQPSPPAINLSIPPPTYPPSSPQPQHGVLPSPVNLPTPPPAYPPASHRGVPLSASAGSRSAGSSYRAAATRVAENRRRQHAPPPISMNTPPPFTRNPESPLVADGERQGGGDGMPRSLPPNHVQGPSPGDGPGESKRRIEYSANTPIMNVRMASPSLAAATDVTSLPQASGGQPSGAGSIDRVDSCSSTSSASRASQQQHQRGDDAGSGGGDGGTFPSPAKRPPPSSVTSTNSNADTDNPTISRTSALGHPASEGSDVGARHHDVAPDSAHALLPSDRSSSIRSKSTGGVIGGHNHVAPHDSISSLPASGMTGDKSSGSSKRSESARRFSFRRNRSTDGSGSGGRVANFLHSLRERSASSTSIEDNYSVRRTSMPAAPALNNLGEESEASTSIEDRYSVRRTSMPTAPAGGTLGAARSGGVAKSTRSFGRSRSFISFGSARSKSSGDFLSEQQQQQQQQQEEEQPTTMLGPSPSVTMTPARFRGHRGPQQQGQAEEEHRSLRLPPSVTMTPARYRGKRDGSGGAASRSASIGTASRSAFFAGYGDGGCDTSAASTSSLSSSSTTPSTPIRARLKSYRRSLSLKRSSSAGGEGAGRSGRDPYTIDETKPSTAGVLLPSLAEYSQNDGAGGGGGTDGHSFNGGSMHIPVAKAVGSGVFSRNSKILTRTRSYGGETSHSLAAAAAPTNDGLQ